MTFQITLNFAAWWLIPSIISFITVCGYIHQHLTKDNWDLLYVWVLMVPILIINCLAWIIGAICK